MTGTTVSHYRVFEELGQGSTATVYHAEDLALGRAVALKIVAHGLARNDGALALFQHEARTASSLNHPNICTIYEVGEHEGHAFIAMELIDGVPLGRVTNGEAFDVERLVEIGLQIGDALDAAHAEAILHRDIKPANIFITRRGQAKLLDFGLAILVPRRKGSTDFVSSSAVGGSAWAGPMGRGGTIPYMSPEQVRGEELDPRSDLFSFGVVLYEMATGRRPFKGNNPSEIFDAIVGDTPIGVHDLRPQLPLELDRIINKALEKNRKLRYQTASDIRADFERLKRDLGRAGGTVPSQARRDVRSGVLPAGRRGPPMGFWSITFAGLSLAAFLGAATMLTRPTGAPSTEESSLTDTSPPHVPRTFELARTPPSVPADLPGPPASVHAQQSLDNADQARDPARTRTGEPARPSESATSRLSPSSALRRTPISEAEEVARGVQIARAKFDANLLDQALVTLRDLLARHRTVLVTPDVHFLMATIYERQGRTEDAMATYIEIRDRYPNQPQVPEALFRLAQATLRSRRPAKEAEALHILEALATEHRSSVWAERALMAKGELEEQARLYQRDAVLETSVPRALVTYRNLVEKHPRGAAAETALWRLGLLYERIKRFDLAAQAFADLGEQYDDTRYDAWFQAGELYRERLNRKDLARAAYARVPPTSGRFREARKRLVALKGR